MTHAASAAFKLKQAIGSLGRPAAANLNAKKRQWAPSAAARDGVYRR